MTLLDRFRSQPAGKSPDPVVRLAYVAELPLEDREAIAAVAREDDDPRVRRAAVGKLMDAGPLGGIAQSDTDESVRAKALEMLRDLASEAFEGTGEAEAIAAVDALADARTIAQIARSAPRESVARRALTRVADAHMLGSIARHGVHEAVRLDALAALHARRDTGEILGVALNGEFKDTAVSAVEAFADRSTLDQIAARGRNKSAVKRARVLVRDMDERAARDAAESAARAAAEHEAARRAAAEADAARAAEERAQPSMSESTPTPIEPSHASEVQTEAPAVERRQEEVEADAARHADAEAAAARAREAEAADAAARASRRQTRLAEIAEAAAPAAALEDWAAARKAFGALRREWATLGDAGPAGADAVDDAVAARFAEAAAAFAARETAAHDADAKARREGLAAMHNLLGRVEPMASKADLSLKAADRALRDVRTALSATPQLPTKADYDDVTTRLKAAQEALTPRVTELREADEWQKWANVTIQEQLCAKMEALGAVDDPEAIAKEVRELQQQWRQAADVPRDKADGLWRRFKSAHDAVWAKCEAHFAAQAQERAENLAKKSALCDQAEALAESTSWIQTADAIKKLQSEWKAIGPVSRGREKAIWDRFRTACDRFFTRRHEDLAQRKGVWAENLAKKDALCARAEALAESTDWDVTANEIKRLQAEWKTIGPVKKSRSEAIWQRFRAACDRFFERYAQRHDTARAERVAAREAICAELEALSPPPDVTETPADLLATARGLRGRWQQEVAARGVDPDRARALDARFADAFAALIARWPAVFGGTDLDPDANRKRMEAIVKKVEDLAASLSGPAVVTEANVSPANRLAAMLKEALAANTIGGKADDDSRWRAAAEDVRQAQAAWTRLGPVPEAARRQLADRFQRASRRILERAESSSRALAGGRGGDPGRPSFAGRPANRGGGPGGRSGGGRGDGGRAPAAAAPASLPRAEHAGTEK